MNKDEKSKIILFCQGGAGDVIAHTPMIRYFKNKYPDDEIVVLSTYSQLLENNPNIDTLIPLKDPKDFYSEHVLGKNVRFFKKHFVYDGIMDEPAKGCKCLPEFICKMYGAEYDGGPLDYFVTDYETRAAQTFMGQYKFLNRPLVLLHCTGAIPSDGNFNKTNNLKDLNIELVKALVEKHKEQIVFIHIGLEGEPKVEGAIDALGMQMREAIALLPLADSYIIIESLFAHCTNALGTHGIVVFQNMSTDFFGYPNNYNVSWSGGCKEWPCNRPVGALLDLSPGYRNPKTRQQLLWECPNQVCAQIPLENLEKVLLESLQEKSVKGNPALAAARATPPPNQKFSTVESPSAGKISAGDTNVAELPTAQIKETTEKPKEKPKKKKKKGKK
jgi:ADP-heptose:LPS heptosyltransferase